MTNTRTNEIGTEVGIEVEKMGRCPKGYHRDPDNKMCIPTGHRWKGQYIY